MISGRLRMVSWGNDNHQTGLVKLFMESNLPITAKAGNQKDTQVTNTRMLSGNAWEIRLK